VRWLRRADTNGRGAVVRLTAAPPGAPLDRVAIRDTSCRVGAHLVIEAMHGQLWARVMLAHIALRVRDADRNAGLRE
jgi:hypothetical protein